MSTEHGGVTLAECEHTAHTHYQAKCYRVDAVPSTEGQPRASTCEFGGTAVVTGVVGQPDEGIQGSGVLSPEHQD